MAVEMESPKASEREASWTKGLELLKFAVVINIQASKCIKSIGCDVFPIKVSVLTDQVKVENLEGFPSTLRECQYVCCD